jgi:hypothetical protein
VFLITAPNKVVDAIHPKAMPVILTTPKEVDTWMMAPLEEALKLQRPLTRRCRACARGARHHQSKNARHSAASDRAFAQLDKCDPRRQNRIVRRNRLDATKLIPEEVLPVRLIGRMVLDRNVDNFFAETEQVASCPANIVQGIDFTNDPLLQRRLFSYRRRAGSALPISISFRSTRRNVQ